jgi:hypothetical protein
VASTGNSDSPRAGIELLFHSGGPRVYATRARHVFVKELGIGVLIALAVAAAGVSAAASDVTLRPDSYSQVENWAKLPPGRNWVKS